MQSLSRQQAAFCEPKHHTIDKSSVEKLIEKSPSDLEIRPLSARKSLLTESDQPITHPLTKTERNENATDSDFFNLTAEEGESVYEDRHGYYLMKSISKPISPNPGGFRIEGKYEVRSPGAV